MERRKFNKPKDIGGILKEKERIKDMPNLEYLDSNYGCAKFQNEETFPLCISYCSAENGSVFSFLLELESKEVF